MHSTNSQNTRVILLRHGQSTYNALGLYQGSSDRPNLSEIGRHQAQQTGNILKGMTFDAVYSSPLKRVQETVKEVLKVVEPNFDSNRLHIVHNLRETDLPAWQGLPFKQVREQFPEDYHCWKQTPHEFRMEIPQLENLENQDLVYGNSTEREVSLIQNQIPPTPLKKGGFKIQNRQYCFPGLDIYDRAQKFWQETLPRHIGHTLLVVSHGGTNRALISTALGISPAHYHKIEQSNCALSILNFPNGLLESAKLESMNFATHVGENFPKLREGGNGLKLLLVAAETNCDRQIKSLAQLLKDVDINLSITADLDHYQTLTDRILKDRPTTLQLQVLRDDFARLWHQSLMATNRKNSHQLLTSLVVAPSTIIKDFIGQIFSMNSDRLWRLQLQPGTLSIIHYHDLEHPPILQAMNVSGN
ncbi:MAG: histidine phosphatase family protein [Cyanosarcina radialis HA8281-LM2]|nr:histidine phosphatase family protein [Cyanosarcina radialis HA8281-LM2]